MKQIVLSIFVFSFCALLFLACEPKQPAAYPHKPITIIVPSKAGGGTDMIARIFAQVAKKHFGQNFVIINKPGAGGQIGFRAIARAKKDGYTIGAIFTPHITSHVSAKRASYQLDDFLPLVNVVTDPGVLVVNAKSPFQSIEAIINKEKAEPKSLSASTTGAGGDDSFALIAFNKACGTQIKDVPSKGSSEQKVAILGGHVDVAFMNYSQVEPNVKAGDLKILATMTKKRLSYATEIPTLVELGYEIYSESSRGFVAPAGLPKDIYQKLVLTFSNVLKDKRFLKAAEGHLLLNQMNSNDYAAYLKELQKKTDVVYSQNPW